MGLMWKFYEVIVPIYTFKIYGGLDTVGTNLWDDNDDIIFILIFLLS